MWVFVDELFDLAAIGMAVPSRAPLCVLPLCVLPLCIVVRSVASFDISFGYRGTAHCVTKQLSKYSASVGFVTGSISGYVSGVIRVFIIGA